MGRTTEGGRNIFEAAATFGYRGVKYFVEKKGVPVMSMNSDNRTAAHIAAGEGKLDVVKYLLDKDSTLVNTTDRYGYTPYHIAVVNGALSVVTYFLEELQVDMYYPNEIHDWNTPLHMAAESGQLRIFRYFVEKKDADANVLNSLGQPPVFLAAQRRRANIIKYMIEAQKDLKGVLARDNNNKNIIFMSAEIGDTTVPKMLFTTYKVNIDINEQDNTGATVCFWASKLNHFDFLKYVVSWRGADFEIPNDNGRTPLHEAASGGHVYLAKFLIERGANKTVVDNNGLTARDCALDDDVLACFKRVARKRAPRSILPALQHVSPAFSPLYNVLHLIEARSMLHSLPNTKLGVLPQIEGIPMLISGLVEYFLKNVRVMSTTSLSPKNIVHSKIDHRAVDAIEAHSVFNV